MTQLTRRSILASGAALSTLLAIGMPALAGAEDGILRVRFGVDMQILDPGYMVGQERIVQYATLPRLVELDLDAEPVTWKPTPYSKRVELVDPQTIEFELNPGFSWSNGEGDVSADDVKYSLERIPDTDWGGNFKIVDNVEVTGPYSGRIHLKQPAGAFLTIAMTHGSASILPSKAMKALPDEKFTLDLPATAGPYKIKEHVLKQRLVLDRDPNWSGTPGAFDEIQILIIEDSNAAQLAYEAGEIDVLAVDASDLPRYTENLPEDSEITVAGNLQYMWVGMNTDNSKLSDVRVRQAIQRGIDVATIQKVAFKGVAADSTGILPPGILGHRNEASFGYDPEAAKALIAEAGAEGLELTLAVENNIRERLLAAQIVQANLAEIGIKLKVLPMESGQFWSLGQESKGDAWKDSELWMIRFGGNIDPSSDYFQWFTSDQVGVWNWERWSNPRFDELNLTAAAETDPDKRAEMYAEMQQIMDDTAAYVYLNHESEAFLHRKNIDAAIDPTGMYLVADFEKIN